jgi:flagellar basal body-associated protein FliL
MEQSSVDEAKKKGLPGLAWVGIGCGLVLLIGAVIFGVLLFFSYQRLQTHKEEAAKVEREYIRKSEELMIRSRQDDQ